MDARNNIATDLFYKVRSRFSGLKLGAETGEITINPEEARFFDFDYMEGKTPIGHVSISLAEPNSMKVYFSHGISEGMDEKQKVNWYGFLKELRQFAKRRLLSFDTRDIAKDNLPITNNNRAEYIWRYYVAPSYESMIYGLNKYPDWVHLVEYNSLVNNPEEELNKIYEFLEVPSHTNTFNDIENACGEQKDEEWGLKGLHDIRPNLAKISQNPIDVIGEENVKLYSKFDI